MTDRRDWKGEALLLRNALALALGGLKAVLHCDGKVRMEGLKEIIRDVENALLVDLPRAKESAGPR